MIKISKNQKELSRTLAGDQLYEDLKHFCQQSPAHSRLASENELINKYKISQSTIRKVLSQLQDQNFIYKQQGKGSFVAEQTLVQQQDKQTILVYSTPTQSNHSYFQMRLQGIMEKATSLNLRIQTMTFNRLFNDYDRTEFKRQDVCGIMIPWLQQWLYDDIKSANPNIKIINFNDDFEAPDVCSVRIDYFKAGQQTINLLPKDKAKIAAVTRHGHFYSGMQFTNSTSGNKMIKNYPVDDSVPFAPEILSSIISDRPDALIFDDNYDANNVINHLSVTDPEFLQKTLIISLDNKHERILPNYVRRLENDGFLLGEMAILTLNNLIKNNISNKGTSILISPQLAESGR